MSHRCQACGYTTNPTKQKKEVKEYFGDLPSQLQDPLKKIYFYLKKRTQTDALNRDWVKLVYVVEVTSLDVVTLSVATYMKNEYHKAGKGFNYLRVMILNLTKEYQQKKEAELSRFGSNPPTIGVKNGNQ